MVKKALQYTDEQVVAYVGEMRSTLRDYGVGVVRERLLSCMNVSERASAYMDYLCTMGSICFRYLTPCGEKRGSRGNAMEGTYCFGGKVWEQVDGVKFKIALKEHCMKDLSMTAQEWIRGMEKYVQSVHEGSMLSPLAVSKSIVGFRNGVYDFSDVKHPVYHPFSDRLPVTCMLDYDYKARDRCPVWLSFLQSTLGGAQVDLIQKYFSLGLVDREKMPQKVENTLWLVGPGGVGKSTIMSVISAVYGQDNVSSVSMGDLISPNPVSRPLVIASVVGKVFNMCGEVQAASMSGTKADAFKSLCSGEPQPVRSIGRDYEMRSDIPYMVFSMNQKPRLSRIDGAITRRILFVPFRTMVREEDRDPELASKLMKELSGIRNWLIEGYRKLEDEGFRMGTTALDEDDSWLEENGQTVAMFLKKVGARPFAYAKEHEKGRWFPLRILYDRYVNFCQKGGFDAVTDVVMGNEMRALQYRKERKAAGVTYYIYGAKDLV